MGIGLHEPVGVAGDQIYSLTYNMMQYCNGQVWVNMSANIGVGSLTSGDWCTTDGTLINCTSVPPLQTAAGGDTQIMYNHSGAYAGSSAFVWDYTDTRLGIGTSFPLRQSTPARPRMRSRFLSVPRRNARARAH